MATIAFDVYGTLIDTDGVVSRLREWIGSQAELFSKTWRSKQLEYSFRRGLMRQYENFAVCTRHALDYCCAEYDVSLSSEQKDELLQSYRSLPAFADVEESLGALKAEGIFSLPFPTVAPKLSRRSCRPMVYVNVLRMSSVVTPLRPSSRTRMSTSIS